MDTDPVALDRDDNDEIAVAEITRLELEVRRLAGQIDEIETGLWRFLHSLAHQRAMVTR